MNTQLKNICFLFGFISLTVLYSGCKDDEPEPENPEELITTLTFTLVPQTGNDTVVFQFRDLDGDGGNAPVYTIDTLAASTMYHGTLELLNEAETPAEDITEEVHTEGTHHQFFFEPTGGLNLSFSYADTDDDGNPVGITSECSAGTGSAGKLKITLRHQPDKSATGVSAGNITNAGGETDMEVEFDVVIQ